jgi:hypothetical protein
MISIRRTLLPVMLAGLWLGNLCLGNLWLGTARAEDPSLYSSPASYRLFNTNTMGPRTPGCGRSEPLPCCNPGFVLDNPRGTGMDDPWRPPTKWPETRYPVVPAYMRPSYGFYETSWRVLPLCNPTPSTAGPVYPAGYSFNTPAQPVPAAQPAPPQTPLPRPPVVPPAMIPAQPGAPAATPPGASAPVPSRVVPPVPLQPQKATPPTNELQPQPPKATPPVPNPTQDRLKQGAVPVEPPQRSAMLELQGEEAPEVRVQAF